MALGDGDVWFREEYRQQLKPLFGNYRNWARYQEIVRQRYFQEMWKPFTLGWRL